MGTIFSSKVLLLPESLQFHGVFMQISSFLVKCSQMMLLQSAVTAHELCLQSRSLYLCIGQGKDIIVFRFIIEYSSLRDFYRPLGNK